MRKCGFLEYYPNAYEVDHDIKYDYWVMMKDIF